MTRLNGEWRYSHPTDFLCDSLEPLVWFIYHNTNTTLWTPFTTHYTINTIHYLGHYISIEKRRKAIYPHLAIPRTPALCLNTLRKLTLRLLVSILSHQLSHAFTSLQFSVATCCLYCFLLTLTHVNLSSYFVSYPIFCCHRFFVILPFSVLSSLSSSLPFHPSLPSTSSYPFPVHSLPHNLSLTPLHPLPPPSSPYLPPPSGCATLHWGIWRVQDPLKPYGAVQLGTGVACKRSDGWCARARNTEGCLRLQLLLFVAWNARIL